MSLIRTTTYQCTAPSAEDSVETFLLQVIAELVSVPLTLQKTSASSQQVILISTVTNAFTGTQAQTSAVGLTGCVRLLCRNTELLVEEGAAVGESWLQTAQQTLLPIVREDKKDELFVRTVQNLANQIDAYLYQKDQTFLVHAGHPTAVDVVTAVLLATAHETVGLSSLPQQAYRWMQTTMHRLANALSSSSMMAKKMTAWAALFQEGTPSPAVKPQPVAATPVSTPSPAPVPPPSAAPPAPRPAPTPPPAAAPAAAASSTDKKKDESDGSPNPILTLLTDYALPHEVYSHQLSMTAEELVANVPLASEKETHTKNLFLRDKKHGLFLVTVRPSAAVQTKELGTKLGLTGKINLRLADESILQEILQVRPGCVGPLAIGLADNSKTADDSKKVTLVLDQGLLEYEYIHSHPVRNDMSVKLTPATLRAFFEKCGVEPVLLDFATTAGGTTAAAPAAAPKPAAKAPAPAKKQQQPKQPKGGGEGGEGGGEVRASSGGGGGKKGETLLALQWTKEENFPQWYADVIVLSEMISYYDISGCYILRPWSYKMWELIQEWFNEKIAALGVENAYFPLFVTQERLEKEKDHVEGFAPEVAWVTRSGSGDLAKPIAVRPTSETIMYPAYSDWIRSHRDLPLKLNQWSNVVRWEFKYPTPFLRTREFLWQEGHTAHATFEDANDMVMEALDLYRGVYEEILAVPVIKGYKTEKEKFAGGFRTTTCEAYIAGSGRAIQGATSHHLGQNFGHMFDITFQDTDGKTQTAWQTSWGLTTRTIGVMVMTHGDNTGLVLPPRVAPLQVVIVPIISKKFNYEAAKPYCTSIVSDLQANGIRVKFDDRSLYNPGWKYNHWEQKGVPIRVEVGPRDVEQSSARIVIRHNGEKLDMPLAGLGAALKTQLEQIQQDMFTKAKTARDGHIVTVTEWKDFVPNLEKNNLVLTPWCGGEHQDWEDWVKQTSREESLRARGQDAEDEKTATSVAAKTLCIPFDQPELPAGTKCIASGMEAKCWVLWGRSY